jgi:hypothetical protein
VPRQRNFWRRAIDRRIVTGGAPGLEQVLAVRDNGCGRFSRSRSPLGYPCGERALRRGDQQHNPHHEAKVSGISLHTSPGDATPRFLIIDRRRAILHVAQTRDLAPGRLGIQRNS